MQKRRLALLTYPTKSKESILTQPHTYGISNQTLGPHTQSRGVDSVMSLLIQLSYMPSCSDQLEKKRQLRCQRNHTIIKQINIFADRNKLTHGLGLWNGSLGHSITKKSLDRLSENLGKARKHHVVRYKPKTDIIQVGHDKQYEAKLYLKAGEKVCGDCSCGEFTEFWQPFVHACALTLRLQIPCSPLISNFCIVEACAAVQLQPVQILQKLILNHLMSRDLEVDLIKKETSMLFHIYQTYSIACNNDSVLKLPRAI